jgi:flagellar protein FliL
MAEPELPASGKKKSSFLSTLIEWLVVTLIAGGAGFALTAMNPPTPAENAASDKPPAGKLSSATKVADNSEAAVACASGGPSLVDLPPIVTNIATPSDTWIRLEGSIVFEPKALAHPEVIAAEIAADELAYLRTISLRDLEGPIGLENIRQDLRDRALIRSNGKITDLLLKTLVLQ